MVDALGTDFMGSSSLSGYLDFSLLPLGEKRSLKFFCVPEQITEEEEGDELEDVSDFDIPLRNKFTTLEPSKPRMRKPSDMENQRNLRLELEPRKMPLTH